MTKMSRSEFSKLWLLNPHRISGDMLNDDTGDQAADAPGPESDANRVPISGAPKTENISEHK